MKRIEVADLAAFVSTCREAGIDAAGMRVVDEVRPRMLDGKRVEVGRQKWVELSAYGDGTVIAARLYGEAQPIEAALRAAGLRLRKASGNIT